MANNAVMQFADRAFLSRESLASLEASLPASMLALLTLGFFQSIVAYSGTFVAQYHGAGDSAMARASARAGGVIALASSAIALIAIPPGLWMLDAIGAPPEVLSRERSYFIWMMAGGFFLLAQMAAVSYFTGIGSTKIVYRVNLAGNLLNIVLDPFFIFEDFRIPLGNESAIRLSGLGLGISGAAAATIVSMAFQWAFLAYLMRKHKAPEIPPREMRGLIAKILRFGVPSGLYSSINVLSFTIFVFFTGKAGDLAFAVSNACFGVNYLLIAPIEGFAIGAQTLVGHARGRGDEGEARRLGLLTVALSVLFAAILSAAVLAAHRPIISMFIGEGFENAAEFHSLGFVLFALMAAWQVFDAADVTLSGALKGAGDTKFVFWWMLGVAFGLWLPLVWLVSATLNTMPWLWSTMIFYVAVMCAGSLARWTRGSWKKISVIEINGKSKEIIEQ